jgi:threonylcarbamoyladenosine tRNA methylthiotransferase MtaB
MKIYLDTVGCRLNQSEIETFARQFCATGHTLVPTPDDADLVVVNTCAVTAAASSDSRQKIRQASRAGAREIVVTGCWSTLDPITAAALPRVSRVIPNTNKDNLVVDLLKISPKTIALESTARQPVPGSRLRTRAFVKVQDGCDNRCTFCVTTIARGSSCSRTISEVLADVRAALKNNLDDHTGASEIVLTGVNLGSWGRDLSPPTHLRNLVETILQETNTPRLRLSSIEPWDLDQDFFTLWKDARLCRHLHLPLQSGCKSTLQRMARKHTLESYAELIAAAHATVSDIAITTDVIVGFPGESDAEFAESLAFILQMQFSGGHVFTYSSRPGTVAARMPNQVPHQIRKERNAVMRATLANSALEYKKRFLDRIIPVLWESANPFGSSSWQLRGLTDNYLRVSTIAPNNLWNQITPAHLTSLSEDGFFGHLNGRTQTNG